MSNAAVPMDFKRAVPAAAGALICLVIILAMFSGPAYKAGPLTVALTDPAQGVGFHFTAENVLALFVIGLISGTFGGMLGMGGGVLKMSCLLFFFGFHAGVAKFSALLAYFVVALGASYRYAKLRFIMKDIVKILIPSSIIGIIFGAFIGEYLPRDIVTLLLGMFLLFISVVMVKRISSHHQDVLLPAGNLAHEQADAISSSCEGPAPIRSGWRIWVCGFPGGFLSAMLGISGGVVTNPLQQVLGHIPIKNAIANTLVKASVTVPIACVMIMVMGVRAGHFDLWTPVLVALCLIPGSAIGSQLGPALTTRMSPVTAHALFGGVALFMGISMLFFSK